MKLLRKVGSTSQIFQIFVQDSSSSTGAGLTGLTNASSSLTAYYHRDTDTTATAISLVTMTVGTFTSSGFKEIDSTNMPGWYQFCPPNAALASGAASVGLHLKGATNMAPLPIEVDLDAQVDVTFWNGTVIATPATAGIPDINIKNMNNVAATSITTINANQGSTQPFNFTGSAGSAFVKGDMIDIAGQTVTAAAGVTFPASVASPTNITAGAITTVTSLTNAPTAGDFTAAMKTSLNSATPVATLSVAYDPAKTAAQAGDAMTLTAAYNFAKGTTAMTESYASLHTAPTPMQAIFEMRSLLAENSVSATTVTTKKIDGSTTAHTYTLDSSSSPTSITTAS